MIKLTYQYKIKPTKEQIRQFEFYLNVCRGVYNYALSERKAWLNSRKSSFNCCSIISEYIISADTPFPSYNKQSAALTQAKNQYPHLKLVAAQCLQQSLKRLNKAWQDFLDTPERGFPRFKSKNRFKSFVFSELNKNCLATGKVKLPVIGWVRIKQSRAYPTGFIPKQITVVKKASGYYLSINFESQEIIPDNLLGKVSIGIDAGIESFLATPRELIKNPKFLRDKLKKLKTLQRRLKKKVIGSNNWLKLQKKIARFHETIANTRKDWLFKLAHYICDLADNIFVEDINFNSWAKGLFGKQALDSGIGGFINNILPYVCWRRGKYYLKVNKNGTSQECSECRSFTGKKELKERIHSCQFCFHTESRDTNSAKIIMYRGLEEVALPGETPGIYDRRAVGQTVYEKACELGLTGFEQPSLLELVKRG